MPELRGEITGDASGLVRAARRARSALALTARAGTSVGGSLVTAFSSITRVAAVAATGITAVTAAVTGVGVAAVVSFSKFESAFAQVRTLVDESVVDTQALSEDIRELARLYGVDLIEATEAAYQAISAGQDPADVVNFLATAFEAATAGAATTVEAVNLLTSVLNTFEAQGLSTAEASDILFTTVRLGKTTVGELAAAMGQVAPIAAAAGVSFAELGAALATTTAQGLSTAEAATAIKASIAGIVAPSSAARGALESIGVTAQSLREEGLVSTFGRIAAATGGAVDQITRFLPNIRAVNAAAILAGNGLDSFRLAAIDTATGVGAAGDAFAKASDTLGFTFSSLRATLKDLLVTVGQALAGIAAETGTVLLQFAENTRVELEALADASVDSLARISAGIKEFGEDSEDIGGVSLALAEVRDLLSSIGRIVRENADSIVAPFVALDTVIGVLSAGVRTAAIAILDLVRLGLEAADAVGLGDFDTEVRELTISIRNQRRALTEVADSTANVGERYDSARFAVARFGQGLEDASASAENLRQVTVNAAAKARELAEAEAAAAEDADSESLALADLAGNTDEASSAATNLATETDTAGAAMGEAAEQGGALASVLASIGSNSGGAAAGLAQLPAELRAIAEGIAAISEARSPDQILEEQQGTIGQLLDAADAELAGAVERASQLGEEQLAAAEAARQRAIADTRNAFAAGVIDSDELAARFAAAGEVFEESVRSITGAFDDQRAAASEAFDEVRTGIEQLDGAAEAIRDRTIAGARAASEEANAAKEAATVALAELQNQFASGAIGVRAFREALGDINAELVRSSIAASDAATAFDSAKVEAEDTFQAMTVAARETVVEFEQLEAAERALQEGFFDLSDEINRLSGTLEGDGATALNIYLEAFEGGIISAEELADALKVVEEQAGATAVSIAETGRAAEVAAEQQAAAAERVSTTADRLQADIDRRRRSGSDPGRLGAFSFGIQSAPRGAPGQRRTITGRPINEQGQAAPRGFLSFDLGGLVGSDQLARLKGGERVLTGEQNSGLTALVAGLLDRRAEVVNVSPTFNISGGASVDETREMARALLPELTRATRLGLTGKRVL